MQTECLDAILKKRETFPYIWKLLNPETQFQTLYAQCKREWNKLTYREQQQLYVFLDNKKKRGEIMYQNPLHALVYTKPHPYDWNEKPGIDYMFKHYKMDSAFYNGHYGVYTKQEADIYEMTHRSKMNY